MTQKKFWLRPTQITQQFPKNKYHFSSHLTNIGDWIETDPMSKEDRERIKKAVNFWAWHHNVRISFRSWPTSPTTWAVRITLVGKGRIRLYDKGFSGR